MDGFLSYIRCFLFGSLVGAAASWAYLRKQLFTDQLTEVPNQIAVPKLLRRSLRRVTREKTPLSIALLDLDDFKAVNAEFGYASADQLLREFSGILKDFSRRHGIRVLRYKSGDEFLLIMERIAENRACEILEELQETIRAKTFTSQEKPLKIRFSAGRSTFRCVSKLSEVDTTMQLLLEACENDLLAAKAERTSRAG
jgi:diguanylate cyclase (GGDEF)-like protein